MATTITAPCLNHILYHQTTRTPLYIHPCFWSNIHLTVLRVVTTSPPSSPSSPSASQQQFLQKRPSLRDTHYSLLRRILNPLPYFNISRDIMCLITSIINSVQRPMYPIFQIFLFPQKQLDFRLGSITTSLKPYAHIEHTDQRSLSVPFLAYNNPDHRRLQKQLHTRSRHLEDQLRWNLASVSGQGSAEGVDPFDVSVLLAMAQMQERMLPPQTIYKTYLFFPNDAGTHVNLLTAQISAGYLECFRDPLLPLTHDFIIDYSEAVISETGKELTDMVYGVLGSAPTLPLTKRKRVMKLPVKKAPVGKKSVKGKRKHIIPRRMN